MQLLDSVIAALEQPENHYAPIFYQDPALTDHPGHGIISSLEIEQMQKLVLDARNSPLFEQAILKQASQKHVEPQWLDDLQLELSIDEVSEYIQSGASLVRTGGISPVKSDSPDADHVWYIQGERFEFAMEQVSLFDSFLLSYQWSQKNYQGQLSQQFIAFIQRCLANGWWQLAE